MKNGHSEVISLLFDEFDLTHEVYGAQSTLLHFASANEDPCAAKLLLENSVEIKA